MNHTPKYKAVHHDRSTYYRPKLYQDVYKQQSSSSDTIFGSSCTIHYSVHCSKLVNMIREIASDQKRLEIIYQYHAMIPVIIDKHDN